MKVTWHFIGNELSNFPLVAGNCWVYAGGIIIKTYYFEGIFFDDHGVAVNRVTHWAWLDMPQPPEE